MASLPHVYPCRPNPIGLSIVHLLRVEGNRLDIEGIDMLDNTSLLDIKPYVPEFDIRENVQIGWYGSSLSWALNL